MNKQIENNFKYHAPNEEKIHFYTEIRKQAKRTAELINERCPNSREKSLAMTKLEEAVMWANASIARNDNNNPEIRKAIEVEPGKFAEQLNKVLSHEPLSRSMGVSFRR